ncbi:hypothetical protein BH10BAC1_BH10BAC1_05810 [soil metagenome]
MANICSILDKNKPCVHLIIKYGHISILCSFFIDYYTCQVPHVKNSVNEEINLFKQNTRYLEIALKHLIY